MREERLTWLSRFAHVLISFGPTHKNAIAPSRNGRGRERITLTLSLGPGASDKAGHSTT